MKIIKRTVSIVILVLFVLRLMCYAEAYNTDINVTVVKQTGEINTTVYTGLLSGYEDGKWTSLDFSQKDFAVIFDWEETDITYIYPVTTDTSTVYNSSEISLSEENILLNTAETSLSSDSDIYYSSRIKINGVNVGKNGLRIVDNGNFECSLDMENQGTQVKTLSMILATYTADNKLYTAKTVNITLSPESANNISLIYEFNAEQENHAKLMLWDMTTGMIPVTAALSFDGSSGINAYYYDADNRLTQIDKTNGVSLLYTYDKMGNMLTKTIRE